MSDYRANVLVVFLGFFNLGILALPLTISFLAATAATLVVFVAAYLEERMTMV